MDTQEIKSKIESIFTSDKIEVTVNISTILLKCLNIYIHDNNPPYKIDRNSPIYLSFSVTLQDYYKNELTSFELDLDNWHHELKRKHGLKFKKIKGKTIEECLNKLYVFLSKNKDLFLSLI